MEINLSVLWEIFLKRLWVIILAFVLAVSGAYFYCEYLVTPQYRATASILVTNGAIISQKDTDIKTNVSATDISASLDLAETVTDILKTPEAYRKTAKASNGKYSYDSIVGRAYVARRSSQTLFIDISFSGSNTETVIDLANLFAETSCEYITEVIPYSNATVVAKSVGASLVSPKTLSTMSISGVIVAVLVYALFFIYENNNKIIRNEEDLAKHFDIPIIGSVPDFENSESGSHTLYKKGK